MVEAVESVVSLEQELPLRGRCEHRPCQDRVDGDVKLGAPVWEPREFVVDLLEDTGTMDAGEARVLLSLLEWVEVEARGEADLLEGLRRLRGAVMKAAAAGR